ncbi:MAG: tetratricopeptide repeat protein, partial [Rubripirellula sp.]
GWLPAGNLINITAENDESLNPAPNTPSQGSTSKTDDKSLQRSSDPKELDLPVLLPTKNENSSVSIESSESERSWSIEPLSENDYEKFAKNLEQAVASGDLEKVSNFIDWDTLIDTACEGIAVSKALKQSFILGIKYSPSSLEQRWVNTVLEGGTYQYLRTHVVDDDKRVLFRLQPYDGGLNYHDLILRKREDGQVAIVDIHVFTSGELLSTTMRRGIIPVAVNENRNLLQKLIGWESDFVKNITTIEQMTMANLTGDFPASLSAYKKLPQSLQDVKNFQILRIHAAAQVSDSEYQDALEAFRTAHPNDSGIDLLSVDAFVMKEQFEEAINCIDRVNRTVGGDAELLVMKADIEALAGNNDRVKTIITSVLKDDPSNENAIWTLVQLSLAEKDFSETSRLLTKLESELGIEIDDLTAIPVYEEYTASPEFALWLQEKSNGGSTPTSPTQ